MSQNVVSVSTLVHYLKSKLESDNLIQKVLVEGEIHLTQVMRKLLERFMTESNYRNVQRLVLPDMISSHQSG